MRWIKYESDDCYAIVIYNYESINSHHMDMRIGDFVYIKEQYPGWYHGFKYSEPCILKIFPNTHVKILSNEIYPDLWAQINSWIPRMRDSYLLYESKEFDLVIEAIEQALTEKRFDSLQDKMKMTETNRRALISKMEYARKKLGLPIESHYDKADKINLTNVSTLDLYAQHNKAYEENRNTSAYSDPTTENISIFVKMLNISFERSINVNENLDVIVSLYKFEDSSRISRLSESYTYRVGMRMNQCDLVKTSAIVTKDIQFIHNHKVFLVFQFIRIGQMLTNRKHKKEGDCKFRRPQGVAVLDISSILFETHEITIKISIQMMQREDPIEAVTERLIQEYSNIRSDCRSAICIQFKVLRPDEFTDRYIMIHGMNAYYPTPIKSRRNYLYLNLYKADIDRGVKKSDPNFEIDISIRDNNGNAVCMPKDEWRIINNYKSVIYYHISKPKWNELICVPLFDKLDKFPPQTHIRFIIWHKSLNDRDKPPIGVAYLKFFPSEECCAFIENKENENAHVLTIHKMSIDQIKAAKYLHIVDDPDDIDSINSGDFVSTPTLANRFLTMGRKKKHVLNKDTLSVQTLLISNEYTFDRFLSIICYNKTIDNLFMYKLVNEEIILKKIDVNELTKFAVKILESSLELLQKANDSTLLGRNILMLLGEMFNAIKNLPDYQNQMNKFINETMHFNVHKQILNELIYHVPESDSNTLRASDWLMKIVVKSYQNLQTEFLGSPDDAIAFNRMVSMYLQKLEFWASQEQNKILRSTVLRKAGPIINALIPVCRLIGMAKLVNSLLERSQDLDAITKSELTMDSMNSKLFIDEECRKIILPETTKNILELLSTQINKICHGRDIDQDHMLDNICDKMVEFIQLHERSWQRASPETADMLVYELLIEHNMLRSIISIVSSGLEFLKKDDSTCKLLYKPLMVLVTVIITSLNYINPNIWEIILSNQIILCDFCRCKQMTNNYDMLSELITLILQLQVTSVFPEFHKSDDENKRNSYNNRNFNSSLEMISKQHMTIRQPWLYMLFVQSRQFLVTLRHIHEIIMRPYYFKNIAQIHRNKLKHLCCCHPSEKLQADIINHTVESIRLIISQPFLKLETLPPSSALRIMEYSQEFDGDIRLWGASLIKEIWHDLDILKIKFSQFFFNTFSKLTTIQNYKIRFLAVECMFDIVHLDHHKKKTELITQIDQSMEKADSSYCEEMTKAFKEVLNINSVKYAQDNILVEHIILQMNNIQECSHHLNDNSPINGMIVINNLRKFYQKMGRSDIIGRYLFKLKKIHEKIKNFTEIGYTLLELSSFYKWTNDIVSDTFLPVEYADCEYEWELKARLLDESLKHFEQEDWEQGIEVCKELITGFTNFVVDFVKLSEIHRKMSELLKKIMFEDRPESLTYIIFYIGVGFPKFITELPHKSIVLKTKRGPSEISINLNAQFKNTTVEKKFPTETDFNSVDKRIFFMPIKSYQFDIPSKYNGKFVKQRILKYYENFQIQEFVYRRLVNNTEEDHKKRKIEGCLIKCDGKLPNILSVVPVESLLIEAIDPFNEALHDLECQIRKDEMLYQDYEIATAEKKETMYQKMKDVILKYISPVSGGVSKLVEMIPENEEMKLSHAGDVVSQVFELILKYLETFEIYDTLQNYDIFLSEFRKIIQAVSLKLDICEEDFNINTLLDQFHKSRKNENVAIPVRKQSICRIRHEEDGALTIGRKTKMSRDFLGDLDLRGSSLIEEDISQIESPLSRIDSPDCFVSPKRQSAKDIVVAGPPIPPKPKSSMRGSSPLNQRVEPTQKPNIVFTNNDSFDFLPKYPL